MSYLPNFITGLRIVMSIVLLFTSTSTPLFFILYMSCGISDILDGWFARRLNCTSKWGAKLDSGADLIFALVILSCVICHIRLSLVMIIWIIGIVFVRLFSIGIVAYKYHTFASLHTYANKVTGALLWCVPFVLDSVFEGVYFVLLGIIASIATIEELIINSTSKQLEEDIKGMMRFGKIKRDRRLI